MFQMKKKQIILVGVSALAMATVGCNSLKNLGGPGLKMAGTSVLKGASQLASTVPGGGGSGGGGNTGAPRVGTMTFLTYRQCTPAPIPGFYSSAVHAQAPVLRINAQDVAAYPEYFVNPANQRVILFEKFLSFNSATGKFEGVNEHSFSLTLPDAVVARIIEARQAGKQIVTTIEETEGAPSPMAIFASTAGLPGHGAIPTAANDSANKIVALNNLLPAGLQTFQLGVMLKTGNISQSGDEECDAEGDPLAIDFGGRGFKMGAPSVSFDLANTGLSQTFGWLVPQSGVGFLALDVNRNGRIDTGAELFSNYMEIASGILATNGFEALKSFDRPDRGGNGDGFIDARDAVFSRLFVWMDQNANGRTDAGELIPLANTGVVRFDLRYLVSDQSDGFGNKIYATGSCQTSNGGSLNMADLWFAQQR